jgi:hypothetical protein
MMLLQADAIQVGQGILSVATFGLVLRLTFGAGKLVQQVEVNTARIDHLEAVKCPHAHCPLLRQGHQHQMAPENEG